MKVDNVGDVRAARIAGGRSYEEFVRTAAMSVGLYELPAGATDLQHPHAEDEVYYVIAGKATFTCADERREVGTGDTIYVAAQVPHRFSDITEDLSLLVVFAPAESN